MQVDASNKGSIHESLESLSSLTQAAGSSAQSYSSERASPCASASAVSVGRPPGDRTTQMPRIRPGPHNRVLEEESRSRGGVEEKSRSRGVEEESRVEEE